MIIQSWPNKCGIRKFACYVMLPITSRRNHWFKIFLSSLPLNEFGESRMVFDSGNIETGVSGAK